MSATRRAATQAFVVATLTSAMWGCDTQTTLEPAQPRIPSLTILSGRVLDHQTHRAIAGVMLSIDETQRVMTDQDGVYYTVHETSLSRAPSVTIRADANGYHASSVVVDLRNPQITIPAFFLRPISSTTHIGPEGGVLESQGLRVRIPPGALTETVALSATLIAERAVSVHGSDTFKGITGIELRPSGTRFVLPVEITAALPTSHTPDRRLHLFGAQENAVHAEPVGVAVVGSDGRSARFFLSAFPEAEIQIAGTTTYRRFGPNRVLHKLIETKEFACGIEFYSVETWTGPAVNPDVPDYPSPLFSADPLRYQISAIQASSSGIISNGAGEPYKLVVSTFTDIYAGTETGYYDPGDESGTVAETIGFQFEQKSIEFKKVPCHNQGGS